MDGDSFQQNLKTEEQLKLLRIHRRAITTDLDVAQVIPNLIVNDVLSLDDKERIQHEATFQDKGLKLLDILEVNAQSRPSEDIITKFIESLKESYDWLYDLLNVEPSDDVLDFGCSGSSSQHSIRSGSALFEDENDNIFESPKHRKAKTILEAAGITYSPICVERKELVENIRKDLRSLDKDKYLVIQGMAGSGKSTLAKQSLNSARLIETVFPDGVFWLPIGKECSESKDAIFIKMRILIEKLEANRTAPASLEHASEMLRSAFQQKHHSLLVLDGVWRSEVIRSFDVGCLTMVITRDSSVMDPVFSRTVFVKVDCGFSEGESLELFRRSLNFSRVEELPNAARTIHSCCKGSPMVVSLISSLFQDHPDEIREEGRWSYYLETLSKRRYSKIRRNRDYEHESIYDAIALSVESLTNPKRDFYYDLALFQDDVPIPCPVLEVLWSKDRYEVEDIMKHFVKKSLAMELESSHRSWHVYSVHSLQLDYLKYQLRAQSMEDHVLNLEQKLHERLINAYLLKSDSSFEKLPDDDYIYYYLGYHLHKSQQYSLFPEIYLNLLFIGEKLRICGKADLISDMKKYKDFIVGESEERNLLWEEIKTFVELVGYVKYNEDVDIIQLALQNPNFKLIQDKAIKLALAEPTRLYFQWIEPDTKQWKIPESSVICTEGVRSIKFIGDTGEHFLAGLSNGTVELYNLNSFEVLETFYGHRGVINCIDVLVNDLSSSVMTSSTLSTSTISTNTSSGPDDNVPITFCTASDDCQVKIWSVILGQLLRFGPSPNISHSSRSDSPSPKLRPNKWSWGKLEDNSDSTFQIHTKAVQQVQFLHSGSEILVLSASANEVLVWSKNNQHILFKHLLFESSFTTIPSDISNPEVKCIFGTKVKDDLVSDYLVISFRNSLGLVSLQPNLASSMEASTTNIIALLSYGDHCICSVSENDIGLWKIENGFSENVPRRRSLSPRHSLPLFQQFQFPTPQNFRSVTSADAIRASHPNSFGARRGPPSTSNSLTLNGHLPKSSPSDYNLKPSCSYSISVDNGETFVKLSLEKSFLKRNSGLFVCAAIYEPSLAKGNCDSAGTKLLACATSNMKIALYNLSSKDFLAEFNTHCGPLNCLDFSLVDEYTLLTGSEDQTVLLWDVKDETSGSRNHSKRPFFASVWIPSMHDSEEGNFMSVFSTENNCLQFFRDTKLVQETGRFRYEITSLCISSCGTKVVIGTDSGAIYSVPCPRPEKISQTIPEPMDDLECRVMLLKFEPETSKYLVGVNSRGSIHIWKDFRIHHERLGTGNHRKIIDAHFLFGQHLAFVYELGSVEIIDLGSKAELKGLAEGSLQLSHPKCSCVNSDSTLLAIGYDKGQVLLCHIRKSVGILKSSNFNFTIQTSAICSIAFNQDSTKLAVGFSNGLITVSIRSNFGYEFEEDKNFILHKGQIRELRFSSDLGDGRQWLLSLGDRLAIWSLDKPVEQIQRTSYMAERRRRKSGDSRPSSRLSLELPTGIKIGKQGKRELLNFFSFRGSWGGQSVNNEHFTQFLTLDETGILYHLRCLKQQED